jgi:hypothetical protein
MALFQDQDTMLAPKPPAAPREPLTPGFHPGAVEPLETVQGQLGDILKTDERGNYLNPVVQQSQTRQHQLFNARGLLNSSMAMQAGGEAAISKATEIAGADARTHFENRRANEDAALRQGMENDNREFTVRQDYQRAVQTVGNSFQRQIDTINASNMTSADKGIAIQQAAAARDGEIAFQNNLFSRMPAWQQEWLSPAIPNYNGGGIDVSAVTNQDTLANIANDPAQPQALRQQATERLRQIQTDPAMQAGMVGGAAAGPDAAGANDPMYAAYRARGGTLPYEQWRNMTPDLGGGGA